MGEDFGVARAGGQAEGFEGLAVGVGANVPPVCDVAFEGIFGADVVGGVEGRQGDFLQPPRPGRGFEAGQGGQIGQQGRNGLGCFQHSQGEGQALMQEGDLGLGESCKP